MNNSSQPPTPQENAAMVVVDWMDAIYPHQPLGFHIKRLTDIATDAITAAEQRGRVAGLIAAAAVICPDCRKGAPLEYGDRHFYGGTPQLCAARKIHALIAQEEAANVT